MYYYTLIVIIMSFFLLMLQELAKQIDDYTATYEPDDQLEWSLVLGEIRAFIEVGFCMCKLYDTNLGVCAVLVTNPSIRPGIAPYAEFMRADTLAGTRVHNLESWSQKSILFRGEITPLSSSYNISGLVPVCWLLFQCF